MSDCPHCHQEILSENYKFCPYCAWRLDENTPRAEFELGKVAALETLKQDIKPWIRKYFAPMYFIISVATIIALFFGDDFVGTIVGRKIDDQLNKRLPEDINRAVKDRMTDVSLQLRNLVEIFPVMEYEFYRFREVKIVYDEEYFDDLFEKKSAELNRELSSKCSSESIAGEASLNILGMSIYPYIVNETKKLVVPVSADLNKALGLRYKGYKFITDTEQNKPRAESIADVFEGSVYFEYVLFISTDCYKGGRESVEEGELYKKIREIIFNMKEIATFKVIVNGHEFWSVDIPYIELEGTAVYPGSTIDSFEYHAVYMISKKKSIEGGFNSGADIKKRYREILLKK
jgi:hypothetical protein